MYKVKINKKECIGCGSCEALCPHVFAMDGDKAVVKQELTEKECVNEAEAACATKAISVKKVPDKK